MANSTGRKLAAMLAAKAAGYGRLAQVDEARTHCRVSSYLDAIAGIIDRRKSMAMHFVGNTALTGEVIQ